MTIVWMYGNFDQVTNKHKINKKYEKHHLKLQNVIFKKNINKKAKCFARSYHQEETKKLHVTH